MRTSVADQALILLAIAAVFPGGLAAERARKPSPAAFSSTPRADKWKVTVSTDPLNDKPIVVAALRAETPIHAWGGSTTPALIVRCQTPTDQASISNLSGALPVQPGLDVYIETNVLPPGENSGGVRTIEVRFDERPPDRWRTIESTDKKALFIAPIYATQLVITEKVLLSSHRMFVRFTGIDTPPAVTTFDLRGFARHVSQVLDGCPPVDHSRWRLPAAGHRFERRNAARRPGQSASPEGGRPPSHRRRALDGHHGTAQI